MEEPIGQIPNPLAENLVSRKRKNDEVEPEIERPVPNRKKLKWETHTMLRAEGKVEHAVYFSPEESLEFFEGLEDEVTYLSPEETAVSVYGKHYNLPRDMAIYGDKGLEYKQSKRAPIACTQWCPILLKLKNQVESIHKVKYNMCIVNKYQNGESNNGVFAHDEEDVDQSIPIASISFGATRDYKFKPNNNKEDVFSIPLQNGTIVIMHDPTNRNWKHAVPKTRKKKSPTIAAIFRTVIIDDEEDQNQDPDEK